MVVAEIFVLSDVIDDDWSTAIPNFVADCGLDVEFPTREEPEGDFISNGASDPTVLRHSC
jgi:hypothetical protein